MFPSSASPILLIVAAILVLLSLRGYLRARRLLPQHRAWLTVAAIFVAVVIVVELVV